MARPREFDQDTVLNSAMERFWMHGYDGTSVRDIINETGLTGASLYNAFGDKRSLYGKALDRYVEQGIADRIRRCEKLAPREAVAGFLGEILARSLGDPEHKGCMLVNTALDVAPHDPGFREIVSAVLVQIETFFRRAIEAGQSDGTITTSQSADDLARHLLGAVMGLRVLARVRPERALLEGIVRSALALLECRST